MGIELGLLVRVRGVRSGLIALAVAGGMLFAFAAPAAAKHSDSSARLPIVFVHGGAGSGAQYASVAKRFASNGYPPDRIKTFEYDSSSAAAIAAAPAGLDNLIDQLRAHYHVDRVNLVGHSLGTFVSGNYLSVPARAAKIAHYVGVDGASNPSCGIGDPNLACMGIFRGTTGDVGGSNVYFNNTQSHVEAATSPQSFAAQYKFFTGKDPKTTLILPEPPGQVRIAGRAVDFPQNAGIDGATLRIWEVKRATGARKSSRPVATLQIGPNGDWGPVKVNGKKYYEFELRRPDTTVEGNLYYQPFIRDDYWVRLLSSPPNSGISQNTITGPDHAAAVLIRYREWWTTNPSGQEDILRISTKSRTRGNQPACQRAPERDQQRPCRRRPRRGPRPRQPGRRGELAQRDPVLRHPAVPDRRRRVHARDHAAGRDDHVLQRPEGRHLEATGAQHPQLGVRRTQDLGEPQRLRPRHQQLGSVQEEEAEPLQTGQLAAPSARKQAW